MNTLSIKKSEIDKHWWIADADGQVLGRFASRVAQILRGKHKVNYTPHMDMGDFVVIINADKIQVTGNKEKDKNQKIRSICKFEFVDRVKSKNIQQNCSRSVV